MVGLLRGVTCTLGSLAMLVFMNDPSDPVSKRILTIFLPTRPLTMKVGFGCCSVFLLIALMRWLLSSNSESEYLRGSLSVMELFFLLVACLPYLSVRRFVGRPG